MPAGREFELKFIVDAQNAQRLFRHPALVQVAHRRTTARLVSTYFDTPDAWLRRHGVSLRIRRSEDGCIETLKASRGTIDRAEWEHPAADEPDIDWLKTTKLWPLLKAGDVRGRLEPAFVVDVERLTVPITHKNASIETAFDEGTIRAKGLSLSLREFELELLSGPRRAVFALGRRLVRDLDLVPSLASKSERGYALGDLTWGRPVKGLDLDLGGTTRMAPAFAIVIQACLNVLLKNAALIGENDDTDAVHKARVALRRLRSIITLFRPVLRRNPLRRLRRDLAWASRQFGEVRDRDVFRADLAPLTVQGMPALIAIMDRDRRRARARLRKTLTSARWRLLSLDLLEFAVTGVKRGRRRDAYRPFARARLAERRRRLARRTRRLGRRSSHALHEIRKKAKTLRYGIEAFASVSKLGSGKRARRLRDMLRILQETLGDLHDREAVRTYLSAIVDAPISPTGVTPASWAGAAFAAGQLVAEPFAADDVMPRAEKAARQLRRSDAFD